jgi:dihydrodipicolinate synthase/N-acetylneuraminate lyase
MSLLTAAEILADPIANYPLATVAAFDPTTGSLPRRKLDEAATRNYLERLSAAGAPAVLIAASTGHGHLRTTEELAQWFTVAASARLGSMVKMALLRPEDGVAANEQLLKLLHERGYAVVFVRPGTNLSPTATAAEVAANMQPLIARAAELGLAVGVYSIPDVSGLPLSAEATALLVAGPGGDKIVAVKVTEAVYETSTLKFLQHPALVHLKIVQGWDPHLAQALQDGPRLDARARQRCGVTSGPMSFAVYQYLHIFAAAATGNWTEVSLAQSAVTTLFQSMQDDPRKFADLQRAKCVMGLGEPLTGTVSPEQIARLFVALDSLPRPADEALLARSLDLLGSGPYHADLASRYLA